MPENQIAGDARARTIEMTGAEILVRSLEDLNVSHVFGYPGATILPVFHALAKSSISIVVNSN